MEKFQALEKVARELEIKAKGDDGKMPDSYSLIALISTLTNISFDPTNPINWWTIPNQQDVEATEWLLLHHSGGGPYIDKIFWEYMFVREGQFRPRCRDSFNFPLEYAGKKYTK